MAPAKPWICTSCGDLVPADKTSCPSCARAVNTMQGDVVDWPRPVVETDACPRCGGRIIRDTHVCSRCGADDRNSAWHVVHDEPEESESEIDEETEVALTRPHLDDKEYDEYLSREFGMKPPKRRGSNDDPDADFQPTAPSRTSLLLIGLLVLGVAVLLALLTNPSR